MLRRGEDQMQPPDPVDSQRSPIPTGQCVGVLMGEIEDGYQTEILAGISRAATRAQTTLLVYVGGQLPGATDVFRLATPKLLDAVLLMSGAVGNRVSAAELSTWCRSFAPLPSCSIAVPVEGMPSVTIDNQTGMRQVVEHLIVDHGHRRIAFVAGPRDNPEAKARLDTYWGTLRAFDLELERELVVEGNFDRASGVAAVRTLLDERGIAIRDLDAIVAADDSTAFGVLEELDARTIDVPKSVSVVGFDDVIEARYALPTLTTVRQPLRDLGERAMRAALSRAAPGNGAQTLHTSLVCRRSCGCYEPENRHPSDIPADGTFGDLLENRNRRQLLESAIRRAARGALWALDPGWEERLVIALRSRVVDGVQDAFIREWEQVLRSVRESGAELGACFDLLHLLRAEASRHAAGGTTERSRLDAVLYDTLALTSDVQRSVDAEARASRTRLQRLGATLTGALSGSFDLDHVSQTLRSTLPALGVHSVHLGIYNDASGTGHLRTALAFDTAGGPLALDGAPYPADQLVGEGFRSVLESRSHVVLPLMHGHRRLGIGVFELAPMDGYNYLLVGMLLGTILAANVPS